MKKKQKIKFSKLIITCLLVTVLLFTVVMTVIFCVKGAVPDSLVTSFFVFAGGEAGILGLIKHGDTKYSVEAIIEDEIELDGEN